MVPYYIFSRSHIPQNPILIIKAPTVGLSSGAGFGEDSSGHEPNPDPEAAQPNSTRYLNVGTLINTYTILRAPYYSYSTIYPETPIKFKVPIFDI